MALLELTNVSVRFSLSKKRPDLVALDQFSLSVEKGSWWPWWGHPAAARPPR